MRWVDVEQNSDEWFDLRLGKATSSHFGAIMANDGKTFSDTAKRYALQLALEQITGQKSEYSFSNIHMERGNEQEPIARMLYENITFETVTNGGFFDCGSYGDSPDGLVNDDGGIEIKCVIAPVHFATLNRESVDPAYKWQLIGHLDCSGRDWFDFVSYCSDFHEDKQLLIYRTYRDQVKDELIRLRERREHFLELVQQIKTKIL